MLKVFDEVTQSLIPFNMNGYQLEIYDIVNQHDHIFLLAPRLCGASTVIAYFAYFYQNQKIAFISPKFSYATRLKKTLKNFIIDLDVRPNIHIINPLDVCEPSQKDMDYDVILMDDYGIYTSVSNDVADFLEPYRLNGKTKIILLCTIDHRLTFIRNDIMERTPQDFHFHEMI